jgi:hypothetical protein
MQIVVFVAGKPVKSARILRRFRVLREWNKSKVYSRRLARPAALRRGG